MKANNELDFAKDETEFAELEDDPKLVPQWSPKDAIERMEEAIRQGKAGKPLPSNGKLYGNPIPFESQIIHPALPGVDWVNI